MIRTFFYENLLEDIVWSVANDLPAKHEENLPLSCSYSAFQRMVSEKKRSIAILTRVFTNQIANHQNTMSTNIISIDSIKSMIITS